MRFQTLRRTKVKADGVELILPIHFEFSDERARSVMGWTLVVVIPSLIFGFPKLNNLFGHRIDMIKMFPLILFAASGLAILEAMLLSSKKSLGQMALLFRLERLRFTAHAMIYRKTFCGIPVTHSYHLKYLQNVRFANGLADKRGKILCDYGRQQRPLTFGRSLTDDEARALVTEIGDMVALRCHVVEWVIFAAGVVPPVDMPVKIWLNPETERLTTPCPHLQKIIILAAAHDFHRLERFVTYAINALGQNYLKHVVTVQVYGEADELLPNLRNMLSNLCREVVYHPAAEFEQIFH